MQAGFSRAVLGVELFVVVAVLREGHVVRGRGVVLRVLRIF